MSQITETRPGGAGSGDAIWSSSSLAADQPNSHPRQNTQAQNLRSPRAVREAKLELLREAMHEACGFIRLHAEACQSLAEAGDDAGLLHSLGRLIAYAKEAAAAGRDLRNVRKEGGKC
jgi:hypothetical protein